MQDHMLQLRGVLCMDDRVIKCLDRSCLMQKGFTIWFSIIFHVMLTFVLAKRVQNECITQPSSPVSGKLWIGMYVCAQNLFSISVSKYKDYMTKKIQCICVWSLSEWQQPKNKGDQSATLHIHMLTGKNMSHLYSTNLLVLCISSKMVCYWIKHVPVTFSFYQSCKARTAIR